MGRMVMVFYQVWVMWVMEGKRLWWAGCREMARQAARAMTRPWSCGTIPQPRLIANDLHDKKTTPLIGGQRLTRSRPLYCNKRINPVRLWIGPWLLDFQHMSAYVGTCLTLASNEEFAGQLLLQGVAGRRCFRDLKNFPIYTSTKLLFSSRLRFIVSHS